MISDGVCIEGANVGKLSLVSWCICWPWLGVRWQVGFQSDGDVSWVLKQVLASGWVCGHICIEVVARRCCSVTQVELSWIY